MKNGYSVRKQNEKKYPGPMFCWINYSCKELCEFIKNKMPTLTITNQFCSMNKTPFLLIVPVWPLHQPRPDWQELFQRFPESNSGVGLFIAVGIIFTSSTNTYRTMSWIRLRRWWACKAIDKIKRQFISLYVLKRSAIDKMF